MLLVRKIDTDETVALANRPNEDFARFVAPNMFQTTLDNVEFLYIADSPEAGGFPKKNGSNIEFFDNPAFDGNPTFTTTCTVLNYPYDGDTFDQSLWGLPS